MSDFTLFIDSETIKAATASDRGLLAMPKDTDENPTLNRKSEEEGSWSEKFNITSTDFGPKRDDPEIAIITVQYTVPPDCPYSTNIGQSKWIRYYINKAAVRDATHAEFKGTRRKLGVLSALIRACGYDLDSTEQVPYHEFFGGEKPLVGQQVWGVVRQYKYTSRAGEEITDQEIRGFTEA